MNTETKEISFKEVTAFAMTSPKAKVMRITDTESGKQIVCTPDHKIWTENRGYVMAKDLNETDVLKFS
jgi:intein/homing endonuclease